MKRANLNSSLRPNDSNQSVYVSSKSSKTKKVKKSGCGCGNKKKRS